MFIYNNIYDLCKGNNNLNLHTLFKRNSILFELGTRDI